MYQLYFLLLGVTLPSQRPGRTSGAPVELFNFHYSKIHYHNKKYNFISYLVQHLASRLVLKICKPQISAQLVTCFPTVPLTGVSAVCPGGPLRQNSFRLVNFWSFDFQVQNLPNCTRLWGEVKFTAAQGAEHEASGIKYLDFFVKKSRYVTRRTPTTQMCWSQSSTETYFLLRMSDLISLKEELLKLLKQ